MAHRGQLPLLMSPEDEATFENFVVSPENRQLVSWLEKPASDGSAILLWGPQGAGRTHLLRACCHRADSRGAIFLPLQSLDQLHPEILTGLDSLALICIDDLELAAGNADWELALMRLLDSMHRVEARLVMAASAQATDTPWRLADLRSRLQQVLTFRPQPLNEQGIREAFALRASNRGLELASEVADYVFVRARRRLDSLMEILERLDEDSLRRQRRVTIPLVKEIMGW